MDDFARHCIVRNARRRVTRPLAVLSAVIIASRAYDQTTVNPIFDYVKNLKVLATLLEYQKTSAKPL